MMADISSAATSKRKSSDTMKRTDPEPPLPFGISEKVETEKFAAANDEELKKDSNEEEVKEAKPRGLQDYFVS